MFFLHEEEKRKRNATGIMKRELRIIAFTVYCVNSGHKPERARKDIYYLELAKIFFFRIIMNLMKVIENQKMKPLIMDGNL